MLFYLNGLYINFSYFQMGCEQVTCFQAANQASDGEPPKYGRVAVPLVIIPSPILASNNQEVIEKIT